MEYHIQTAMPLFTTTDLYLLPIALASVASLCIIINWAVKGFRF